MAISAGGKDILEKGKPRSDGRETTGIARPKPGLADYLAGEAQAFKSNLTPYLPQELIGGSVPYVAGTEDETVWNAASQACGTEKVHFVYSVDQNRCWYLACPSSSLASNPDSWCPLAAALPGNSEYWDRETVYLYEQEGLASALRWEPDTNRMQVFLGASRTLLPRIQSMDANFVTINAEVATIAPWKNRQLMTEKLSRATARMVLVVGLIMNAVLVAFLAFQFVLTNTIQGDLADVKKKTQTASEQLLLKSYAALQSETIKHMVRIQELLTQLKAIDGTLVKYEVQSAGSSAVWEALVPQAFSGGRVGDIPVEPVSKERDGRVRIRGRG